MGEYEGKLDDLENDERLAISDEKLATVFLVNDYRLTIVFLL